MLFGRILIIMFYVEQTFVMIKPEGVKKGVVGDVISRFEHAGLKLVAIKMVAAPEDLLKKHYKSTDESYLQTLGGKTLSTYEKYGLDAERDFGTKDKLDLGKLVMSWLLKYMKSGPVIPMVWEGRHAVENVISLVGPTMPVAAPGGTIRGDFSTDSAAYANQEKRGVMNIVHASGSIDEANIEKSLWFEPSELHKYKNVDDFLLEEIDKA